MQDLAGTEDRRDSAGFSGTLSSDDRQAQPTVEPLKTRDTAPHTATAANSNVSGVTARKGFATKILTDLESVRQIVPQWRDLFEKAAGGSPFSHPSWMLSWAEHFVRSEDLRVAVVFRGTELVGLAPLYVKHLRMGLVTARSIRPIGTGNAESLTEAPRILVLPGLERQVLPEIVTAFEDQAADWAWVELALYDGQGWFEPEWLGRRRPGLTWFRAGRPEACVVFRLPDTGERLPLKRNAKESVRRARNRLAKDGHEVSINRATGDGDEFQAALDHLSRLHAMRAQSARGVEHHDALGAQRARAFALDAISRLARDRFAEIWTLTAGGHTMAAHLVLRTPDSLYFSLSGHDPQFWDYNAATLLMAHVLQDAIDRGCKLANLSRGPRVAKLRWSEELDLQRTFFVVKTDLRATLKLAVYWVTISLQSAFKERRFALARLEESSVQTNAGRRLETSGAATVS